LSGLDALPSIDGVVPIPRAGEGPAFPAPWAARAFALAVALNARGVFSWGEWSEILGAHVGRLQAAEAADPEAYWRAWLAALEEVLERRRLARSSDLLALADAWRRAAAATPHGEPILLPPTLMPTATRRTRRRRGG
jgi:nitrile hydratase accessory protein